MVIYSLNRYDEEEDEVIGYFSTKEKAQEQYDKMSAYYKANYYIEELCLDTYTTDEHLTLTTVRPDGKAHKCPIDRAQNVRQLFKVIERNTEMVTYKYE